MIPDIYIEQWKKYAPWLTLAMVEQDMVITKALILLYGQPKISSSLAFRGGTALNKIFITPASRYSEDLDFVQIVQEPIGETINAIRSVLDNWLGEPKRKLTERSVKLIYRYQAIDNTAAKLKIEINTTEHDHVDSLKIYPFAMSSEWFAGLCNIVSYSLNELMATKLRALFQRRKGRDLFDLWYVLENNLIDVDKVIFMFQKYCQNDNIKISQESFQKNLEDKMKQQDFKEDIIPLLTPEINWNFDMAFKKVADELIQKL